MKLIRESDANLFSQRVMPFLIEHEAENCLPIGILNTLTGGERYSLAQPYLAAVESDAGVIVATAIATPPFQLTFSHIVEPAWGAEVAQLVADDLIAAYPAIPGAQAAPDLADTFAAIWTDLTSRQAHVEMRERIYQLTAVQPTRPAPGAMRRATQADRALLRDWFIAFNLEALGRTEEDSVIANIDRRLAFRSSGVYLWEVDGQPVSFAGYGGPTPHGMRIGPVYTPPELRGRGYATALVAAMSQRLLDEGRTKLFLFTDLSNPTSNHIYMEIGYQPVRDVVTMAFGEPPR